MIIFRDILQVMHGEKKIGRATYVKHSTRHGMWMNPRAMQCEIENTKM